MGVYATRDGHINLGVGAEGHWRSFCGVLGRPELASDPRYDSVEKRYAARPELRILLEEIMSTQDSAHWLDACEKASVPAGPIYSVDAMFDDPQVQHLGIAQPVTHPVLGDIRVIGEPVGLSRTPASVVSPTPDAGEHNDEILAELGYDAAAIAQLRADGAI
jgi:crotonobetainyl-CoA:carnitine CoA-transferase CaiB-like acyl-CoA transferase